MIKTNKNDELKGYILVLITGLLWGTIGLFIALLTQHGASSSLTSFLRMGFSFIILVPITLYKNGVKAFKIDKQTLIACLLLGLFCQGIFNVFYSMTVNLTGITIGAVFLNTAPIFTAIASCIVFKEHITRHKFYALIINIVGCILAVTGGKINLELLSISGVIFGLISGFLYAMTAIIGRFANDKSDVFTVCTYSYLFATIFLGLVTQPWNDPTLYDPYVLLLGFLYALIPTSIAYIIYYNGVKLISESSKVPVLASIETVIAAFIGIFAFQEHINGISLLGIFMVMISIGLMNTRKKESTAAKESYSL